MFAVFSVVIAVLTVLLVKGSLIYYRHPSAPHRLREDKSLQTTLSSSLTIGIVAAIFLMGQFLADLKDQRFGLIEIGVIAIATTGGWFAWRWLTAVERRLDERLSAQGNAEPGTPSPPEAPRPRPAKGTDRRRAA